MGCRVAQLEKVDKSSRGFGGSMQVGDLVYVPYFKEYGTLVKELSNRTWRVVYTSGCHSLEYEEDVEVICK